MPNSVEEKNDLWLQGLQDKFKDHPEHNEVRGNPNQEGPKNPNEEKADDKGNHSNPNVPENSQSTGGNKLNQLHNTLGKINAAHNAIKDPKQAAKQAINQKLLAAADKAAMNSKNAYLIAATKSARFILDKKFREDTLKKALAVILIPIILLFLLLLILFGAAGDTTQLQNQQQNQPQQVPLTLNKTGPTQAKLGDSLVYTLTVSYPGTAQDISLTDPLPQGTDYVSSNPPGTFDGTSVSWSLNTILGSVSNVNTSITITLKATKDLTYIINQASGTVIGPGNNNGGGTISGNIATLLPNPLPADPTNSPTTDAAKASVISIFQKYPEDIKAYKDASAKTGIPWQILAGIHFREGGANPNNSLRSGRPLHTDEPDVDAAGGCAATAPIGIADGIPEPLPGGGCGFSSLLDSAINSAILLKGKVSSPINSYQQLVIAASRYNGGGNANCGKSPYTGCPPTFASEDDAYAVNLFDNRHGTMYIIYCGDNILCQPPKSDPNPGVVTVIKWVSQNFQ